MKSANVWIHLSWTGDTPNMNPLKWPFEIPAMTWSDRDWVVAQKKTTNVVSDSGSDNTTYALGEIYF